MTYEVDVTDKPFAATGNGITDDRSSIQAAIDDVGSHGGGIVKLPKGNYRLATPLKGIGLRVKHDGVVLCGNGPDSILVHHELYAHDQAFVPLLFQNGGDNSSDNPEKMSRVGVRDLTVKFHSKGPNDSGAIQFNACEDWFCERVTILGDRQGMLGLQNPGDTVATGSRTNGIAASWGSYRGLISDCLVDGVSKPGFYVAWAEQTTLKNCVAQYIKNVAKDLHLADSGFSVAGGSNVVLIDCDAHHCGGYGFQLTVLFGLDCTVQEVEISGQEWQKQFWIKIVNSSQQKPPGYLLPLFIFNKSIQRYQTLDVDSLTYEGDKDRWKVILKAPENIIVDTNVVAALRPFSNVKIVGGSAQHNSIGLAVGQQRKGSVGKDLLVSGFRSEDNSSGQGISVNAGEDLCFNNCISQRNQSGILVQDVASETEPKGVFGQTTRVTIVGCTFSSNEQFNVRLNSCNHVTITNTVISRPVDNTLAASARGIEIDPAPEAIQVEKIVLVGGGLSSAAPKVIYTIGSAVEHSGKIIITDIVFSGYDSSPENIVKVTSGSHGVKDGFYSLTHPGSPEHVIYAPILSEYRDSKQVNKRYRKLTQGNHNVGWQVIP
jgi:hypothetical protein